MKISELMQTLAKRLAKYGDLEVQTTWEGTHQEPDESSIYAARQRDGSIALFIDADGNSYKENNAIHPFEGEPNEDEPIAFWTIKKWFMRGDDPDVNQYLQKIPRLHRSSGSVHTQMVFEHNHPPEWGPLATAVQLSREEVDNVLQERRIGCRAVIGLFAYDAATTVPGVIDTHQDIK